MLPYTHIHHDGGGVGGSLGEDGSDRIAFVMKCGEQGKYEEIIGDELDEEEYWTNMTKPHNFGLCVLYGLVGFIPSFISTPLAVYLVVHLNAHPIIQNQVGICMALPWAFKIAFGFLSDALPIFGERRRPYIFFGTLLWSFSHIYLGMLQNPMGPTLGYMLCIATVGMVLADTTSDAMIVERSTKECEGDHGHLQSLCYAMRFGAAVLGAVAGGLVYNDHWAFQLTFSQIMYISGILPLVLLVPALLFVKEMKEVKIGSSAAAAAAGGPPLVKQQLMQVWKTVKLKIVYMPMLFIFIYNLFQVPNVAWTSYLQLTLKFTPAMLAALSFGGRLMTFVGVLIYKKFFLNSSWRAIYIFSTCLLAFLSVLQLLLIFQINTRYLHVSNFLFSLGDDVMSAFISGIQFLPLCIVYMKLCPGGSEGATYSLLTTFSNIALILGNSVGSIFSLIWDVSNGAMKRNDLSGLWRLTVLTSCLSPLPLALLSLLPSDKEAEKEMRSREGASKSAGVLFLVTLALSLCWIIGQGFYVLLDANLNRP